jgi:hypothetical protein
MAYFPEIEIMVMMVMMICRDTLSFGDTPPSNGITRIAAVFVTTIRKGRCTPDTQCTAGHTHDEYCNMLLTPSACNSRVGSAAR